MTRDTGGDLITALIDEVFQLNGRLLRAGDTLVAKFGLTSARWQVLGAIGPEATTIARIARRRGLRRQSVREIVTRLRADGLVDLSPNPADGRSPLVTLTPKAERLLTTVQPEQSRWANQLGEAVSDDRLADAIKVLATIRATIDA